MSYIVSVLSISLFLFSILFANQRQTPKELSLNLIGIMVDFQLDDDPLTSGDGKFLTNTSLLDSIEERCSGFIVDRPSHNKKYFESQMLAVSNYYKNISNNNIMISYDIIESNSSNGYYTLPNRMIEYAKSDSGLVALFNSAIDLAKEDIKNYNSYSDNISEPVLVVFHAGISQDFSLPYIDPTIYDIKSAYIDNVMFDDSGIEPVNVSIDGNIYTIENGILLPETQNHIFYDVVEDIWPTSDYCDIQIGLVGTFALQLSYALNLPILYNSDDLKTSVGIFGLTDYGYNNGRGIAPSVINPWTRTSSLLSNYWSETIDLYPHTGMNYEINIPARDSIDIIYRVNVSNDEYFLIENRNNWISGDDSIDSLRFKNKIFDNDIGGNNKKMGHWFDNLIYNSDNSILSLNEDSIIVSINNYDIGFPGSGILIWHIKEPLDGIVNYQNVNIENMILEIEEADGSIDIGYDSYAFFSSSDPTNGTSWDMWYKDNDGYNWANQNPTETTFSSTSSPNSNTKSNVYTGLNIKINSSISRNMDLAIKLDSKYEIDTLISFDKKVLGNTVIDNIGYIIYSSDLVIYKQSSSDASIIDNIDSSSNCARVYYNNLTSSFICTSSEESYLDEDGSLVFGSAEPMGYITNNDSLASSMALDIIDNKNYALGDINLDGLDETVFINNGNLFILHNNGLSANNFPLEGNYIGVPLIVNILNDKYPEIIVRNNDSIDIINYNGEIIDRIVNYNIEEDIFFIPNWRTDKIALRIGDLLYLFDQDLNNSYWLNEKGQDTNYPLVSGYHKYMDSNLIDANPYFYPNPIKSNIGKFRFYNEQDQFCSISIYNTTGFLVEKIDINGLSLNNYNEIPWEAIGIDEGIYFADFSLGTTRELIKIMVLK